MKFIGNAYPSIGKVRKGHTWDIATVNKIQKMVICPDVKDIEAMELR